MELRRIVLNVLQLNGTMTTTIESSELIPQQMVQGSAISIIKRETLPTHRTSFYGDLYIFIRQKVV